MDSVRENNDNISDPILGGQAGVALAKSFSGGVGVRAAGFSVNPARQLLVCLLAPVAVCFLAQPATAAQVKEVRRVLFVSALGSSNSFTTLIEQEIRAALEKSPYQIEVYTEYLESVLFPDAASQQEIRKEYIRKYRNRQPHLIIVMGSDALKFMVDSHARFFPGVPIVFCEGVKELAEYPKLDSNFAGVWIANQFAKTLDAALQLQPATKHVVVVGGSGWADRIFEAMARKELRSYEARLEFTYLTDLEMAALLERLKRLPNGTIILYVTFSQDAAGTRFMDATQSLPMVIAAANAPVFAITEVFVGQGTVGGYVNSDMAQGQAAAGIAVRVLQGETPQNIPVVEGTNVYKFDWRALRRWGFRESDLPPGSIVLYRQPSVWEQYKWWISGALGLLVLESLLIAVLLSNLRLRRRLEKSLKALAGQLLHSQDDERRRMARDLHDGTAQDLNAISLCLSQVLEDRVLDQNGTTRHLLEEAHSLSRKALQEVRSVSYALHPPMLEEAGLVPALRWYLDGLMKRTSLRIVFDAPAGMGPLPPEVESTLFRIVQESISNILRHSGADTVEVRLEHDSKSVRMNIKDNGRGMKVEALTSVDGGALLGVGIAGMRERVRQFRGKFEIRSGSEGTTVLVSVPVSREQTNHLRQQSHRATEKQEMQTGRDKAEDAHGLSYSG